MNSSVPNCVATVPKSEGFLRSRRRWLRVETVDRPRGGYDVVVVVDGTYSNAVDRRAMVAFYANWIAAELGARG